MISRSIFLIAFLFINLSSFAQSEVYELRTYHLEFATSEKTLHDYFEQALIPAFNRNGVEVVGAFEEANPTLPKKLYLLIPYNSVQEFGEISNMLQEDETFQQAAASFWAISPDQFPYQRYETSLMLAISGFPNLQKPAEGSGFYELRTYQGYNEDALRRKLKMFNDKEFDIFRNINFPIVFFGKNIAGDQMPSLTYLLATKDRKANSEAWQRFGNDSDWKRISGMKEYENTVSNIIQTYLQPLPFSQL